jgi:hypothetical protein
MKGTVRPFRAQDLGLVLRLWESHGATTEDFLAAIGASRPTVTDEMVDRFREDAETYARY